MTEREPVFVMDIDSLKRDLSMIRHLGTVLAQITQATQNILTLAEARLQAVERELGIQEGGDTDGQQGA